ncbi:MAG: endonuclease III, partial [Candidatus Eiseniibacteriota bacterium]
WAGSRRDAFSTLVRTVISQATTRKSAAKAFETLAQRFAITPEALAQGDDENLERALRVAGLHRSKARRIKTLSRAVSEKFDGSLDFIHSWPLEESRKALMSLPGVGPKTADIVLLFGSHKATIPVDTHVHRVSKRLSLASAKADYEEIQEALQSVYPPEDHLAAHLLLIALGRKYCRARNPVCSPCPVNALCPSKTLEDH